MDFFWVLTWAVTIGWALLFFLGLGGIELLQAAWDWLQHRRGTDALKRAWDWLQHRRARRRKWWGDGRPGQESDPDGGG